MTDNESFHDELIKGLKALAESAFPKKCANCGRSFESAEQFLSETQKINAKTSGLKQVDDEDGSKIVEVFRNCPCGSTLMDFFGNRRDLSEAGEKRRDKFDKLLNFLSENGLDKNTARTELIKVAHGETSEILSKINPPTRTNSTSK